MEALKGEEELLNGDGDALKSIGEPLKGDGDALKGVRGNLIATKRR